MTRINPQTPLAKLINPRLSDQGISRVELMKRLGYANPSKGLRRFDEFMATGRIISHLLKGLPNVLGLDTFDVEAMAATTRQQIADREDALTRERFRPHILVLKTVSTLPTTSGALAMLEALSKATKSRKYNLQSWKRGVG